MNPMLTLLAEIARNRSDPASAPYDTSVSFSPGQWKDLLIEISYLNELAFRPATPEVISMPIPSSVYEVLRHRMRRLRDDINQEEAVIQNMEDELKKHKDQLQSDRCELVDLEVFVKRHTDAEGGMER